jgi:hypothetical protein
LRSFCFQVGSAIGGAFFPIAVDGGIVKKENLFDKAGSVVFTVDVRK